MHAEESEVHGRRLYRHDPEMVRIAAGTGRFVHHPARNLELVMIKDMTVIVKKSNAQKSIIPSWMGGRMSLSSNMGKKLRQALDTSQKKPR